MLDTSSESGSVMFTGNVLELTGDDDPFIVTYSVNAKAGNASLLNDVRSLFELAGSEDEQED